MRIVFHGQNAAAFITGFDAIIGPGHRIQAISDRLSDADAALLRDAEVIVGTWLDPTLPKLEKVRLYHAPAAGIDRIDTKLLPAGTPLCNCFGHENAIAEYVMTALLLRRVPIPEADRGLRQGDWRYWAGHPNELRRELGSQTIGLLGFGHIGKTIAARAKAFGMRVTVANRSAVAPSNLVDQAFPLSRLGEFMASADAIVVSLPHLPETTGLVDAAALAAMRPDAVILNVGRGPVIDEAALFDALKTRRIGGAIIDTWYQYPTPENPTPQPSRLPFSSLDNVVMTPHMSGWTDGTIRRRQQTIAENIRRLADGKPLINRVA